MCANENGTGDQVEQSELSLDSLGEDNGEDDGDLMGNETVQPDSDNLCAG